LAVYYRTNQSLLNENRGHLLTLRTPARFVLWLRLNIDETSNIVLEIKIKRVRFIAGLAEMNKAPYFTGFSHFGATGRHGGVLYFFSHHNNSRIFLKKG